MGYDRNALVNCIKRYYDLLVRAAYLNPHTIEAPPPDGWSDEQLVVDILRTLGRTENVIDLLRHMPYIKRKSYGERLEVLVETVPINYLRNSWRFQGITAGSCVGKSIDHDDVFLMPDDAAWPSSFISLTEGRESTWWIIDTDEGVIFPVGYTIVNLEAPEDQPWRRGAYPQIFQEYFDKLCNDIVALKTVPVNKGPHNGYDRIVYGEDKEGQVLKKLFLQHGWPEAFQRDAYLDALLLHHSFEDDT